MKTVSGKDLARLLEKHGWELKRVTGSHHIYGKTGHPARISVPIHGNASLKIGLLRHLEYPGFPKMSCDGHIPIRRNPLIRLET